MAATHIAVWAAEVVDFKSVKTSGYGTAPWTSTNSERASGKPESDEGPPEACRLF